jgi:hypothetical protein
MFYVKWIFRLVLLSLLAGFLHYTLPQRDVVRIVETEVRRVDFGENSIFWAGADTGQSAGTVNRDVRFINAVKSNGRVMVYRNEDTGWGWPPYFKFDTANLQARASDLISKSNEANPTWVAIRHYGWRSELLSTYPNGLSLKVVEGPDVRIIPWTSIIVLVVLVVLFLAARTRWRRFKARRVDPVFDDVEDRMEAIDDHYDSITHRLRRWWRGKARNRD